MKISTDKIIKDIQKKFGPDSIMKLGDKLDVEVVSTGCLSLDLALGVGGIPKGRIIEIFGQEASGKTTLAQHIIAEVQKQGGVAAFIDMENALDIKYATNIGIKESELLLSQPSSGEEALDLVEALVYSGGVDIIVIDSVAALVSRKELEGEMGDSHIALQARLMSQAMRKLSGPVAKNNVILIFINQIREKVGVVFGNPETTPGGRALKFYASVRIEMRGSTKYKQGEVIIGNMVKCKIIKNKVAPPFTTCEFDIEFGKGISIYGDVLDIGVKKDIITKAGNTYTYGDIKLGVGVNKVKEFLKNNKETLDKIVKQLKE